MLIRYPIEQTKDIHPTKKAFGQTKFRLLRYNFIFHERKQFPPININTFEN